MNKVNFEGGKKYPMNPVIFDILLSYIDDETYPNIHPLVKEKRKDIKKMWFYTDRTDLKHFSIYYFSIYKNKNTHIDRLSMGVDDARKVINSYRKQKLLEIFTD